MTQLTYYPPREDNPVEPEIPNVDYGTPRSLTEVRHGFTLAQLDRIAALATNTGRALVMHYQDRRDEAWSAIVEHLYAAEEPPTSHQLVEVGRSAIYDLIRSEFREMGFYRQHTDGVTHGPGSSPKFRWYWECITVPARSPEGPVVERMALAQILPRLAPAQRKAIIALAATDRYETAAALLGVSSSAFKSSIALGRRRFRELWHEGETPSRPWGTDRRADRRGVRKVMETFTRRARDARRRVAADVEES